MYVCMARFRGSARWLETVKTTTEEGRREREEWRRMGGKEKIHRRHRCMNEQIKCTIHFIKSTRYERIWHMTSEIFLNERTNALDCLSFTNKRNSMIESSKRKYMNLLFGVLFAAAIFLMSKTEQLSGDHRSLISEQKLLGKMSNR